MALIHRDGRPYEAELGDEPASHDGARVFWDGTKFVSLAAAPTQKPSGLDVLEEIGAMMIASAFDAAVNATGTRQSIAAELRAGWAFSEVVRRTRASRAPMPDCYWAH